MSVLSKYQQSIFTFLAILFLILGVVTFLSAFLAWKLSGFIPWGSFVYVILDLLISYGLWNRQFWVLLAFFIHLIFLVVASIVKFLNSQYNTLTLKAIIPLIAMFLLCSFLWYSRNSLDKTRPKTILFLVLFLIFWIVPFFINQMIIIGPTL